MLEFTPNPSTSFFQKIRKRKNNILTHPSSIRPPLSVTLKTRHLLRQILRRTKHQAADQRVRFEALQKPRGRDVGADLGDDEDGRGTAVGMLA